MPVLKRLADEKIGGLFEEVYRVELNADPPAVGFIAIHNTHRGPALGGCRIRRYAGEAAALSDCLRLAEAMTWKSALAGLPLGGGKMVVDADPNAKTDALLSEIARAVDALRGRYITAEDMGTSRDDMARIARITRHVAWREGVEDPSPATAFGVLVAMDAWSLLRRGRTIDENDVVAVQGAGNVGSNLVRMLVRRGVQVVVSDVDAPRAKALSRIGNVRVVAPDRILAVNCTVLAPCAAGGVIDGRTARTIQAHVICGAANNQLSAPGVLNMLAERGVDYVPDFVANAGGVCHAFLEREMVDSSYDVAAHILGIGARVRSILERADATGETTHQVALDMARSLIGPHASEIEISGDGA